MKWTHHLNNLSKKANSSLSFLQRNLLSCPKSVKETCYKTLVRPTLEYGSCVWDPYQNNQILQLEKIQKRAARFVTGNFDFTPGSTAKNMAELNWPTLAERRAGLKLKTLYKARLGLIHIPTSDLTPVASTTRRNSNHFNIPQSNINAHLHSFFPSTIRLWNSLPQST